MNALADALARRIRDGGPLGLDSYMAAALGDPQHGYYAKGAPIGAAGDFITAPEISQVFGELIGLWCVAAWQALGAPDPVILAELGPGRGTLMADALRAQRVAPGFAAARRLHLVETGEALRARQAEALAAAHPQWHADVATLPPGPLLLIANEFLDALPIRQFERAADGWHERRVALAANGAFVFALDPEPADAGFLPAALADAPPGAIFELRPAAEALARALATRLVRDGGAALFIDYGHERRACGDTFQAVRRHRRHDPLKAPGTADLTAHVDFAAFAAAARAGGARVWGPVPQGQFLTALGLDVRVAKLAARATPAQAATLASATRRLTAPQEMGTLFKAMALTPPEAPAPAGFEAA